MENTKIEEAQLPLDDVGTRLLRAREAKGLSRANIASKTRIAERHLQAIEEGRFTELASRAYALGFSRSYARAVGLDEKEITQAVSDELDLVDEADRRRSAVTFEPGDPARVPSSRTAWMAALGALLVVLAGFFFWRTFYSPAGSLPSLLPEEEVVEASRAVPAEPVARPTQGAVVFTATAPGVWVKFYDASGAQLMQREMALGETYTVPADANGPMIRTARPDALEIAVDGKVVPPLADRQQVIGDVPVSAAALLARATAPSPVPTAAPQASARPLAAPVRSTAQASAEPVAPPPMPEDLEQPSTVSQ